MKKEIEKLRETAQAAQLINRRLEVAIAMLEADQETICQTNLWQALSILKETQGKIKEILDEI